MSEVVGFELRGRNAIITIDNPPVNALSLGVRQGLMERVDRCLLYTSPSPRDGLLSRMPSSA